jgi:hypothetical protein
MIFLEYKETSRVLQTQVMTNRKANVLLTQEYTAWRVVEVWKSGKYIQSIWLSMFFLKLFANVKIQTKTTKQTRQKSYSSVGIS